MGALMDDNPPYRMIYTVVASGRLVDVIVRRDALRDDVRHYAKSISEGRVTDMAVFNRHGVNVTGDWFG
jgi:hypothetical protein